MWNILQCQMWDVVPYPNVAVMWNKVRCRICAIWCDGTCDVMQCQMRCEM